MLQKIDVDLALFSSRSHDSDTGMYMYNFLPSLTTGLLRGNLFDLIARKWGGKAGGVGRLNETKEATHGHREHHVTVLAAHQNQRITV